MLSQDIYDSWNAKTVADLQSLLDNIKGPQIPANVHSTIFKKQVLQKIDKRRTEDAQKRHRSALVNSVDEVAGCFTCCKRKQSDGDRLWRRFECKSITVFENICCASTRCFTTLIPSVKALIQKLSYWESVKPGTDGLSVIGGYIWILSFAFQHLIDSPNQGSFMMLTNIKDIKEKYQELGQAGELFIELAEAFHQHTHHMRADALQILKRLTKRWSFSEENNPLKVRPEGLRAIPRPRKRLGLGLDSPIDGDDDDDVFSVKWSPLTVVIKAAPDKSQKPFSRLHPQDRVTVFLKFLQCTLDKVEMIAEDLTVTSNQIGVISVEGDKKMHGREITTAMLAFSKGNNVPKSLKNADRKRVVLMLNEFWYSLDVLNENVYILVRLVQETRDIIRTCYVYTDIFYKWHMPNYDSFIPGSRVGHGGSKPSSFQAKEILNKLGGPPHKKLSETTSIMALMDFSSSIYQGVVQEIPAQCEGMTLRLRTNEIDPTDEPSGLVSGMVDRRKSTTSVRKQSVKA
ncbi:hypothetical protein Ocin01_08904 [Orchesella cincta]|uniref:Uncharacterized protein n=1 Tax=Orchesella cincta TaxID=48709 RepID=A0A1D2MXS9_ORCCI|nr:hypothetical protein Ocin01_08904 [Orchesella cincta]